MSLNLNTNSITNYAVGQNTTTNVIRNHKCYTNFKASNQDSFERSNTNSKHKTSKMNIALKEAGESRYWIQHLTVAKCIDNDLSNCLLESLSDIINMLSSTVNK